MDLDELIRRLQTIQLSFPTSQVLIATASQVLNESVLEMNAAYRIPLADGSGLGDQDGEVASLFIVTTEARDSKG